MEDNLAENNYWLVKSEPGAYSYADLQGEEDETAEWDGVRNYQARNNMQKMKVGDRVLGCFAPRWQGGEATKERLRYARGTPTAGGMLAELVVATKTSYVSQIMTRDVISVRVEEDQEIVARKLARYDFIAIPVVDDVGKLVGIVTHDDIIDVVLEEADEDVMQLGGVLPLEEGYLQTPLFIFARKRGIWLVILFIATMITAVALKEYEREFEQIPWLVLFIPLILSCGGKENNKIRYMCIRYKMFSSVNDPVIATFNGMSFQDSFYFLTASMTLDKVKQWSPGFLLMKEQIKYHCQRNTFFLI